MRIVGIAILHLFWAYDALMLFVGWPYASIGTASLAFGLHDNYLRWVGFPFVGISWRYYEKQKSLPIQHQGAMWLAFPAVLVSSTFILCAILVARYNPEHKTMLGALAQFYQLMSDSLRVIFLYVSGFGMYLFRRNAREPYGYYEGLFAIFLVSPAFIGATFESFRDALVMASAVYVFVRGLDNVEQGTTARLKKHEASKATKEDDYSMEWFKLTT